VRQSLGFTPYIILAQQGTDRGVLDRARARGPNSATSVTTGFRMLAGLQAPQAEPMRGKGMTVFALPSLKSPFATLSEVTATSRNKEMQ
jgi:hypothetical protein